MRRIHNTGNFFFSLLVSLAFNLDGTIPAWIALVGYLWLEIPPLWVFWALLGLWFLIILAKILVLFWAGTAKRMPPQENKNPYSAKGYQKGIVYDNQKANTDTGKDES